MLNVAASPPVALMLQAATECCLASRLGGMDLVSWAWDSPVGARGRREWQGEGDAVVACPGLRGALHRRCGRSRVHHLPAPSLQSDMRTEGEVLVGDGGDEDLAASGAAPRLTVGSSVRGTSSTMPGPWKTPASMRSP